MRASTSIALICVAGLAVAGCSSSPLLDRDTYSHLFAKKLNLFKTPEWAKATVSANNVHLTPKGPVSAADLVSANGTCAPKVAAAPAEAPEASGHAAPAASAASASLADRPVGSIAGDLASAPMPPAPRQRTATTGAAPPPDRLVPEGSGDAMPSASALLGGIALDMTECQVVRRAGMPSNIVIGRGSKGERKVVLSYYSGNWPGIYRFRAGRLKEIDATPGQIKEAAEANVKRKTLRRRASRRGVDRYYVQ